MWTERHNKANMHTSATYHSEHKRYWNPSTEEQGNYLIVWFSQTPKNNIEHASSAAACVIILEFTVQCKCILYNYTTNESLQCNLGQ
jgi:hypothetical protein